MAMAIFSAAGLVGKGSLLLELMLVLLRYTAMGKNQVLRWERRCGELCCNGCGDHLWKVFGGKGLGRAVSEKVHRDESRTWIEDRAHVLF